ncbi:HAD hydrolase-like protein, partial [Cutibacterium granulosum]
MEAGLFTVLVLSGITKRENIDAYPYRPNLVLDSVDDLIDLI